MKYVLIILALVIGFILGWTVQNHRHSTQTWLEQHTYPGFIAIRTGNEMRMLTLLKSNDVPMVKVMLVEDLDSDVSTLSKVSRQMELSKLERQEMDGGRRFLQEIKQK